MPSSFLTRRAFLKQSSLVAGALTLPSLLRSQPAAPADSTQKLRLACVGVGGRGRAAIAGLKTEDFVAFCDVDDVRAAQTFKEYPDVRRFRDWRRMFDAIANDIDAVTVS